MSFLYGLGATLGTGIGIIFVMLCYYACKDLCEQHEAEKRLEKLRLLDKIRSWNQTQQTRDCPLSFMDGGSLSFLFFAVKFAIYSRVVLQMSCTTSPASVIPKMAVMWAREPFVCTLRKVWLPS